MSQILWYIQNPKMYSEFPEKYLILLSLVHICLPISANVNTIESFIRCTDFFLIMQLVFSLFPRVYFSRQLWGLSQSQWWYGRDLSWYCSCNSYSITSKM